MYVATSHGKKGIRVNTIVPGLIITDAVRAHISGRRMLAVTRAGPPSRRTLGEPDDIADLVVFLASDESRYITGQMIAIDGGMSAHVGHVGEADEGQPLDRGSAPRRCSPGQSPPQEGPRT